jgi:hypothetical protein
MGQVYQFSWRIFREINIFSRFEYHTFYVLYPFVTYLLTLPRIHYYLKVLVSVPVKCRIYGNCSCILCCNITA